MRSFGQASQQLDGHAKRRENVVTANYEKRLSVTMAHWVWQYNLKCRETVYKRCTPQLTTTLILTVSCRLVLVEKIRATAYRYDAFLLEIGESKETKLLKKIQLEIGFIKEMRTTWHNKKVPRALFHYSPYAQE